MNGRGWTLTALAIAILALAGLGVQKVLQRTPAKILTLSNGMQFRFAGTTYGTNHMMESGLSSLASRLPGPFEKLTRKLLGNRLGQTQSRRTSEPTLTVWFQPIGTNALFTSVSVHSMLVDENGVVSGERENSSFRFGPRSPRWSTVESSAFPRRGRMLECVLFDYDYRRAESERYTELGRFRLPNPVYAEFPEWSPEPLPATKQAGDIQVTLHAFASGGESGGIMSRADAPNVLMLTPAAPGDEPGAALRFTVDSPRGTNESWAVAQFLLADATGNELKATSWSHSVGRPAHFSPVLWPDEKAWKLKVRLKRKSGFLKRDLLVFHDVPLPTVGQTNAVNLTNTVNEIECVLKSVVIRPAMTNNSYSSRDLSSIRLEYDELPDGFVVDRVSVTFDDPNAKAKSGGSSWGGSHHESQFRLFPTNQTRATITYAIQQTREVEFMVAPNWVYSTNTVEIEMEAN